jgi:hypothetical protein
LALNSEILGTGDKMNSTVIAIIGLMIAWYFFYSILRARATRAPKIKAAIILLLFSPLVFKLSHDLYAVSLRTIFAVNSVGEVALTASPFKIPLNQDVSYCKRFTNEQGEFIKVVSIREDERYCGEFWRFKKGKEIYIPYKDYNTTQSIYWASPSLKIIGPKQKQR